MGRLDPRRLAAGALAAVVFLALGSTTRADYLPSSFSEDQPYPYCKSNGGLVGLSIRPDDEDLDLLGFLVQREGYEDVVWLNGCEVYTEQNRCCPKKASDTQHAIVTGLAYNGLFDCDGLDTFFLAERPPSIFDQTYIYENAVSWTQSDLSCDKCGAGSPDATLACSADEDCSYVRKFRFTGLDAGDKVDALTIMKGFTGVTTTVTTTWPDMLAVGVVDDSTVYFVDPLAGDCTDGENLTPLGACALLDGSSNPVRPRGLAYLGSRSSTPVTPRLFAAEGNQLYVVEVTESGGALTCQITEQGNAPNYPDADIQGVAYDGEANVYYVADSESETIYFSALGDCYTCDAGPDDEYECGGIQLTGSYWNPNCSTVVWTTNCTGTWDPSPPDQLNEELTITACPGTPGNRCQVTLTVQDSGGGYCQDTLWITVDEYDSGAPCSACGP